MVSIRKALIPAAGKGERLTPITRAVPKEMFPLNCRAVIEYAVEEALRAGISMIGIVIREEKRVIWDYLLDIFSSRGIELLVIDQGRPLGLGHAILASREFVQDEAFAVILPDMIFPVPGNPTSELIECFLKRQKTSLCLAEMPGNTLSRYGSLQGLKMDETMFKITYVSNQFDPAMSFGERELRGVGRTIFLPSVFEYPVTTKDQQVSDGELLRWLIQVDEVWGLHLPYHPYDTGNYRGYVKAVNALESQFRE